MSKVLNNTISRIVLSVAVAIAVFLAWGSLGENSIADEHSIQDPNVPLLEGIWDVSLEFYEASQFSGGTYGTRSDIVFITEQTGKVFTGVFPGPEIEDPTDDRGTFNGAIIGNAVRISGRGVLLNGLFDPNELEIAGSYNNIIVDFAHGDLEAGVFVARKRLE